MANLVLRAWKILFHSSRGQGDPELAIAGREQAERVGERLRHLPIDAIYVTNLTRTHETAAPLAGHLGP